MQRQGNEMYRQATQRNLEGIQIESSSKSNSNSDKLSLSDIISKSTSKDNSNDNSKNNFKVEPKKDSGIYHEIGSASNSKSSDNSAPDEKSTQQKNNNRNTVLKLALLTGRMALAKKAGYKEKRQPVKQTTLNPQLLQQRNNGGMSSM